MENRYVIFADEGLGLSTYVNQTEKVELGTTPQQIADKMADMKMDHTTDIYYSSGMEFGTEVGFETDEAPIQLFEQACTLVWSTGNGA